MNDIKERGAKRRLLVFGEFFSNTTGCVNVDLREIKDFSVHPSSNDPVNLSVVLKYLYKNHPEIEVEVVDSRNFFFFLYLLKYNIKGGKIAWILDGKKVFEGIPTIEQLEQILQQH